jgi:hypothetical protein
MKQLEHPCAGKLLWTWGWYALGMVWLSTTMRLLGLPAALTWAVAAALGLWLAVATREI